MYRQWEKTSRYANTSRTRPRNMVNLRLLTAEICWWVWGTPGNFNGVRVFPALLHGSLHCVSKNVPPVQLAIIFTYTVRLRQFLAQMLPRKYAIKMYFIFPPNLTSASALHGETGNPEIASFHLNATCFFTKKRETQLKISSGQSWTTLHCQNDRLGAPDRT